MEDWEQVLSAADELRIVEGWAGTSLSLCSVSVKLLDPAQWVEENATCDSTWALNQGHLLY